MIYPWQQAQWQYLITRNNNDALPHALLLAGQQGLGKFIFAQTLAEFLLCTDQAAHLAGSYSCGKCKGCQLFLAGTHSDLFTIQPEESSKNIKVDQIRALIEVLSKTAQQGNYQIVIIEPAEAMNIAAANALLKTLEEPPGKVLLILVSHQPALLPATLRSRCQTLNFTTADRENNKDWLAMKIAPRTDAELLLALAEYAPLRALQFAETGYLEQQDELIKNFTALEQKRLDPIKFAAILAKLEFKKILMTIASLITDLIKSKFVSNEKFFVHPARLSEIQKLSSRFSLQKLFQLQDQVLEVNQLLSKNVNLNQTLTLENILINWM